MHSQPVEFVCTCDQVVTICILLGLLDENTVPREVIGLFKFRVDNNVELGRVGEHRTDDVGAIVALYGHVLESNSVLTTVLGLEGKLYIGKRLLRILVTYQEVVEGKVSVLFFLAVDSNLQLFCFFRNIGQRIGHFDRFTHHLVCKGVEGGIDTSHLYLCLLYCDAGSRCSSDVLVGRTDVQLGERTVEDNLLIDVCVGGGHFHTGGEGIAVLRVAGLIGFHFDGLHVLEVVGIRSLVISEEHSLILLTFGQTHVVGSRLASHIYCLAQF